MRAAIVMAVLAGAMFLARFLPSAATGGIVTPPTTQPATQPAIDAHSQRPISYFNAHCGNCHGDYGTFWGEGFAADLDDAQLRAVVDQMARGPGFAPLEGKALDVQVAFHRSLVDGRPFITAFAGENGKLAGEVTPGSRVEVIVDGQPVDATVDGHAWTSVATAAELIRATKGENVTEIKPTSPALVHSHDKPAPKK